MTAAGSIRRDILSAYAASAARVISWLIVYAAVYRVSTPAFAFLALLRATIGILNYTSLGLGPALIHSLARVHGAATPVPALSGEEQAPLELSYAQQRRASRPEVNLALRALFANGIAIAFITGCVGLVLTILYAENFQRLHRVPMSLEGATVDAVMLMGLSALLRLMSDAPGAVLQTEGRIALDNVLVVCAEGIGVGIAMQSLRGRLEPADAVLAVCIGQFGAGFFLFYARLLAADRRCRLPLAFWRSVEWNSLRGLLGYGSLVALAQVADYLFAPTDYVLINRLIGPLAVAIYAPAVLVDGGLLLLASGIASVLLPRTALLHAAGQRESVRRHYIRGTFASALLLTAGSLCVWALSPILFQLWVGDSLPATRRILPLVLAHTVIGGSTAVGRSVLLAMGRVKPYTASVLIAAVLNVILSYVFVRYLRWGLYGIIAGTLVAAVARGVFWTPWYVLRSLQRPAGEAEDIPDIAPPIPLT